MKTIRSPFQFLDPFTLADRDKFFGRDEEIKQLYDLVFRTPLLLIYGLSGTGKTSLIQCGLASKFDGTDWLPLFIRRQSNINDALTAAINKALPPNAPIQTERTTSDTIKALYKHYLRPVFLIFDQFEEIFVLGKPEERKDFIDQIKILLEEESPCTILISIREEYLGQLYPFEKEIPSLFDFRMRVEPMDNAHVKTVLAQSFKKFNIKVEPEPDKCFDEIIENVSQGKSGIELPYLQVYLDMLYRENFERTYPNTENTTEILPPLSFTLEEIKTFGSIENVLDRFLSEQQDRIQQDLKNEYGLIEENTVRQVLDGFVSDEGTKRPVHYTLIQDEYVLNDADKTHFPNIAPDALNFCFKALEQARLIRISDETIELAHDSLAKLIDQRRSAAQRRINELRRRLRFAYDEFLETKEWLNIKQITAFEETLPELNATPEQIKFVTDSRQYYETESRKQIEEAERQARIEKQKRRRATTLATAAGVLFLVSAFFGYYAIQQTKKAKDASTEAISQKNKADLNFQLAEQNAGKAQRSADSATIARIGAEKNYNLALAQKGIANDALKQAETNLQKAKDAEIKALAEQVKTKTALDEAQAANVRVVKSYLKDIDQHIYELEYDAAFEKSQIALSLNVDSQKDSIKKRILETAYFYTESNNLDASVKTLKLLGINAALERHSLLNAIKKDDAQLFDVFEKRYYPTMIKVEGGIFAFDGSDTAEVKVKSFEIAKTETTFWQYNIFAKATHNHIEPPSWQYAGDNPAVNVSWYDAVAYCNWVSLQRNKNEFYKIDSTHQDPNNINNHDKVKWIVNTNPKQTEGYRLPTEPEWEFAARGGDTTHNFEYSGGSVLDSVAWHSENSNSRTHTVATKNANELGLNDMSGNVWEWCFDWYSDTLNISDEKTWKSPETFSTRSLRGGSWGDGADDYRVSNRINDYPDSRGNFYGFRVVVGLQDK